MADERRGLKGVKRNIIFHSESTKTNKRRRSGDKVVRSRIRERVRAGMRLVVRRTTYAHVSLVDQSGGTRPVHQLVSLSTSVCQRLRDQLLHYRLIRVFRSPAACVTSCPGPPRRKRQLCCDCVIPLS